MSERKEAPSKLLDMQVSGVEQASMDDTGKWDFTYWKTAKDKRIKELEAEVLHENDLFIEWRARAEGFETELNAARATIERVHKIPNQLRERCENDWLATACKNAWRADFSKGGMPMGALEAIEYIDAALKQT